MAIEAHPLVPTVGFISNLSLESLHRARLLVCNRAANPAEAREFLRMLGLI